MAGLPPPGLPHKDRNIHRRNNVEAMTAAAQPFGDDGKVSESGQTIDSQGENNKRRSVNIVGFSNPLKRISKMVQSATKINAPATQANTKLVVKQPSDVPLPPAKMKLHQEENEENIYSEPPKAKAAPSIPVKEAPPKPAKVEKGGRFGMTSRVITRISARLKPSKTQLTVNITAAMRAANGGVDLPETPQEPQPEDGQTTPKYTDLPSLLEFYVEDEERAELLDSSEPKIDGNSIIVLNFGEGTVQSGLGSSEKGPDAVYPTLCGEPQSFNVRVMDGDENPIKFGDDAACRRGIYALEWFNDTENGKPKYNLVGKMMAYNSAHILRRALKQDAIILPMHIDMSLDRRTQMICLAFDKVGARAVRVCSEEKVALQYVTGQTHPTGIVVDIGHSKPRCVAVVEGEIAQITAQRTMACGKMMTARMFSLLKQRTSLFDQNMTGSEFAREAKEAHAFVLPHAPTDQDLAESAREFEQVFHLKDGQDVVLGHERYVCAETLFQPEKDEGKLSYLKAASLQQCIVDCLKENDRDIWHDLLRNVVVIGGTAQLPGLKPRLEAELFKLLPPAHFQHLTVKVEPHAGWCGARLASLNEQEVDLWISRRLWREGGESAVQSKLQELS